MEFQRSNYFMPDRRGCKSKGARRFWWIQGSLLIIACIIDLVTSLNISERGFIKKRRIQEIIIIYEKNLLGFITFTRDFEHTFAQVLSFGGEEGDRNNNDN